MTWCSLTINYEGQTSPRRDVGAKRSGWAARDRGRRRAGGTVFGAVVVVVLTMDLRRFGAGFEAGAVGTLAMSVPMMLATLAGKSPMPRPIPNAIVRRVLGEDAPTALVGVATVVAHFGYGGTWGGVLAATSRRVSVKRGIGLGVTLWSVLGAVLMPRLGWGFFGRDVSKKVAPATLFLHVVYGAVVGSRLREDGSATASGERRER